MIVSFSIDCPIFFISFTDLIFSLDDSIVRLILNVFDVLRK